MLWPYVFSLVQLTSPLGTGTLETDPCPESAMPSSGILLRGGDRYKPNSKQNRVHAFLDGNNLGFKEQQLVYLSLL